MKKLMTIILSMAMCFCLCSVNKNVKAQENVTVTFDMQGHGTPLVEAQTIESGSTVTKPTNPSALGYVFDGWYTDTTFASAYDFTTPVTVNKTLYAKWTKSLTFTAQEAGSTIIFSWLSGNNVMYKTTGNATPAKSDWDTYTAGTTITLTNINDTVSFKGSNVTTNNSYHFSMTGKIAASGNVTSLTNGSDGDATLSNECYKYMFYECVSLISISEDLLPATTLASNCYEYMFNGCTGLTSIPENLLPSTTLAIKCYRDMFNGCIGLTSIPENLLPSTTLAESCYENMFRNCTNLTNIPNLPSTTLAKNCYRFMFDCTSLKLSETKVDNYTKPFKVTNTNSVSGPFVNMFTNTGGTFTGTPVSGTQYYIYEVPKPVETVTIETASSPVYKDESCEAVIGPRWHWNEKTGTCVESYSVINTATK